MCVIGLWLLLSLFMFRATAVGASGFDCACFVLIVHEYVCD